jgi:hypothetical protein
MLFATIPRFKVTSFAKVLDSISARIEIIYILFHVHNNNNNTANAKARAATGQ